MKKRKITYGIKGMMTQQVILFAGNTRIKITFQDGSITSTGSKPATFTTDSLMVQHIIENSQQFKKGLIYRYRVLLLNETVEIEQNPIRVPGCESHGGHHHGHHHEERRESPGCVVPEVTVVDAPIPEAPMEEMPAEGLNDGEEITEEIHDMEPEPEEIPILEDREPGESGVTAEMAPKTATFSFNDEARDYLEEFGVQRSKLKTRADIIAAAQGLGIEIKFEG